jgi:hypothetical protein
MNGQRTLAGEAQDWSQQKDVANAAANPRDYIYAQMLGNARGGLAGQPATNQMQMPNQGGMPGANGAAQNAWNPANYNASTGQLGAGVAGMNPLASTQPPGTSGAGTMSPDGQPPGADQWAGMYEQAMGAQNQARQAMLGAQQGPGAGAASALSPGPGSAGMVQPYGGYQGTAVPQQAGQPVEMPMMWGTGQPLTPEQVQANYQKRQQMLAQGQNPQGAPEGLQSFQAPGLPQAGQAGQGMPQQRPGMPQPQGGQQQPQFTTSAFTQQLLKNRLVPGQGSIQGQGQYMTQQQMQKQINPNKIRAQDFMRGRDSEQKGFLGAASAAGYSDEDTLGGIKNNMPKFQAPGAGRMI